MTKVFVYGRLMANRNYHQHYLQGATFLGKGVIDDYKSYILGGLNGMIPEEGHHVEGEIYEVDEKALSRLDHLHNLGTMFDRKMVDIKLENGESMQTEAYIWNG